MSRMTEHLMVFCRGIAGPMRKHCGLLQVAQAVLETLQGPGDAQQDSLLGLEKGLVQSAGDATHGQLLTQLTHTVTRDSGKPLTERSVLHLF